MDGGRPDSDSVGLQAILTVRALRTLRLFGRKRRLRVQTPDLAAFFQIFPSH